MTTTQTTPGNTQTSTTNVGGSTNTNTGTATTNSSGSSSGTTNGSNTSATTGTATTNGQENSTSNTTGTSSSTQNGTSSTTGTATTGTASNSTGDTQTTGNAYLASPVRSIEQSSGNKRDLTATATYNGTPSYSSSTLYVSDSSYLTKMIIYYLRLNGVSVTFDPAQADSVLNVMVDVFGILTTKTDAVVYQNDKVRAKTTIEMAAFDRTGRQMIMPPTQGSYEALYEESKILSLGPYLKQKHSQKSDNLMEDFSMEQQN
ncbi:MAG: hypothetical protein BWK73_16630 [Thiothrix lacustris]|uniref:Uncharacterized protein n=1 Tax=Thiothrix lacustris TaxID=525917 RepID=A0A1Y1QR22_9GAMM|nr:MAG: hypothetical protein BWK73_16630 [Thiothrix lacustris]